LKAYAYNCCFLSIYQHIYTIPKKFLCKIHYLQWNVIHYIAELLWFLILYIFVDDWTDVALIVICNFYKYNQLTNSQRDFKEFFFWFHREACVGGKLSLWDHFFAWLFIIFCKRCILLLKLRNDKNAKDIYALSSLKWTVKKISKFGKQS